MSKLYIAEFTKVGLDGNFVVPPCASSEITFTDEPGGSLELSGSTVAVEVVSDVDCKLFFNESEHAVTLPAGELRGYVIDSSLPKTIKAVQS